MIAIVISLFMLLPSPTLQYVRDLYQQAADSEKKCKELLRALESYDENNHPLFAGYKGSANMIMAKHVSNPLNKLSHFNKGKRQLEKAIEKRPKNVELRCLRFAVQSNVPGFLGYKDEIKADRKFILSEYPQVTDPVLKKNIRYFMTEWGHLSESEKKLLQ